MVNAPNFFPIFLFFLALQSHGEGQQNSPLTNNNLAGDSTADQKFADCCRHELKLKAKTIKDACKYPPNQPSLLEKLELGKHFSSYIACYAAHKNNRDCCANSGVTGAFTFCQDICDGAKPPRVNPKYMGCSSDKEVAAGINKCNEKAQDEEQQK